jgi:hypothetical protein
VLKGERHELDVPTGQGEGRDHGDIVPDILSRWPQPPVP